MGRSRGGTLHLRSDKDDPVDLLVVTFEPLDDLALFEVPNDDLGVLACTGDKPVALADSHIDDEISMSVQTRLQRERIPVPHLQDPIHKRVSEQDWTSRLAAGSNFDLIRDLRDEN